MITAGVEIVVIKMNNLYNLKYIYILQIIDSIILQPMPVIIFQSRICETGNV